jgi:hypothetical protein
MISREEGMARWICLSDAGDITSALYPSRGSPEHSSWEWKKWEEGERRRDPKPNLQTKVLRARERKLTDTL